MGLIPRRHRSLFYKLLLLIPVLWITVAFLMYNEKWQKETNNNSLQEKAEGKNK